MAEAHKKAALIKSGMTRKEVYALFPPSPPPTAAPIVSIKTLHTGPEMHPIGNDFVVPIFYQYHSYDIEVASVDKFLAGETGLGYGVQSIDDAVLWSDNPSKMRKPERTTGSGPLPRVVSRDVLPKK